MRRMLPVLTWNGYIGRDPHERAGALAELVHDTGRPPVIVLEEVWDWPGTLPGYVRVAAPVRNFPHRESRSTIILVRRRGVRLLHVGFRSAGGPDWHGPKHGYRHPPRVFPRATIRHDKRTWSIIGVHRTRPPWSEDGAAYEAEEDTLVRWSNRLARRMPDTPLAMVGDHNQHMGMFADLIGGEARLRGPDGVVARDCRIHDVDQLPDAYGSDHRPVTMRLSVP